ncbi:hypothetical protein [Kaistella antarctica]|uniref:Porin n=1 Tax=Kaistella antarctica TaxID=266748 RepID=A0A3S4UZB0_9FLAO|nr:hypothetical protein [Kaistella antarctica]KEY19852.1 hypothetical protein HY04_01085 [Kaistella antarctica]SEV96832.1 hypothetical protein SAMN05421765_1558 [Kaistella antarctica]VEH96306.1 Uncharacterised protein [Kaistella antarctica]
MKKTTVLLGIVSSLFFSNWIIAQETPTNEDLLKRIEALEAEKNKPKEWDASLYGWVRTEYNFDSRQSAYSREFHLNLYPLDEKLDANGEDINAAGGSNFLAITSRVGIRFKGPDVWGAKATGNIEADFFGNTELNKTSAGSGSTGLMRLRHATATLTWPKTALTFGQTWYPSFITDVFPGVANFNTGIVFNPFGWAGQIKVAQKLTPELTLTLVAYKDREFQTANAVGASVNSATFNSSIPTFHGQLQYKTKTVTTGLGAEYQSLKPVIESGGLVSDQTVNSDMYFGYFKYANDKIITKLYGITGGNLHHLVMLGGFAGYTEPNGQESYKPTKTSAFWIDVASANPKVAPGVFFGYTKNSGVDAGYKNLYIRGVSGARVLDAVWRASARVDFKQNKFNVSPELEYTAAKWGDISPEATAQNNMKDVGNFRAMVRVMYSF